MAAKRRPEMQEEEEHPEHIARYGPGLVSFVETPAQARSSARSARSSLKDDKSSTSGCDYADDHSVTCLLDLFQPPVVRQYVQGGRLFREREERTPDRFELFLDLVLVGIVHQLAESASESTSGATIAKVILTFYPCWSIWTDTRTWLNQSGVDDISQRIQVLALLICLVGFSVNASAIEVGPASEGVVSEVAHRLVRRAVEAVTGEESSSTGTADALHHGPQHAVVAATGFFLVAKLVRILTYVGYSVLMPEFRITHLVRAAGLALVSFIFLGCAFVDTIGKVAILASIGMVVEIVLRFGVGVVVWLDRRKTKREDAAREASGVHPDAQPYLIPQQLRLFPAYNLEHMVERTAAFVTVVLGESVVSLLYIASQGTIGLSDEFARAVFGLTITFLFNAVYFDALSRKFRHAIRRHWFTHLIWDVIHFPMCTGLITASAALNKLVLNIEVEQGIRWQYGGGMAVAVFCVTVTGMVHESLDPAGTTKLSQNARAVLRLLVAIIFALLPLIKHINDLSFLGIYLGVFSAMVLLEVYAKLGHEERETEDHTAVRDREGEPEVAGEGEEEAESESPGGLSKRTD
ncbi:hypothetical protein BCR35DRAFT_307811 [Leucosporidium creatinivorum]|uniref:Bacterial low temperature requirement A protein-domain-containing protein n=1 Tax=Leucosporidium creatinivorum TaxID=106004 RepID=A0A1Y2EL22_9BASI|nr:hypothetical protein BCR35DRAFT_307811 [Leucosporidium creatinivorum]